MQGLGPVVSSGNKGEALGSSFGRLPSERRLPRRFVGAALAVFGLELSRPDTQVLQ